MYIKRRNKHNFVISIFERFAGIGVVITTDNLITYNNYFMIEFRFLWLLIRYTFDFINTPKTINNGTSTQRRV